jgi:xanthine dehydrogenase large subunit
VPEVFEVAFLERATEPGVIMGSKAVGEPPLMLAISAREAIRDAIAQFGSGGLVTLDSPATPERIYWAIERARATNRIAAVAQEAHEY